MTLVLCETEIIWCCGYNGLCISIKTRCDYWNTTTSTNRPSLHHCWLKRKQLLVQGLEGLMSCQSHPTHLKERDNIWTMPVDFKNYLKEQSNNTNVRIWKWSAYSYMCLNHSHINCIKCTSNVSKQLVQHITNHFRMSNNPLKSCILLTGNTAFVLFGAIR